MEFVCPLCKGSLDADDEGYRCSACQRSYPTVCGIPDFRLESDPYISIDADRKKGLELENATRHRTFEQMLDYYYSTTPDDPSDLAKKWAERSMVDQEIARAYLELGGLYGVDAADKSLLDIGCSTGGLLIAASRRYGSVIGGSVIGVDVAFRWLVVCKARLRGENVRAKLVCANAERLPFPDCSLDVTTAFDVLEHVRDAAQAISEARRVSRPGAKSFFLTNNRYGRLREPHVGVFGVGFLPRARQAPYVARRRPDLREYKIQLRDAGELTRLFQDAAFSSFSVRPGSLYAPHKRGPLAARALAFYNRVRLLPGLRSLLRWTGPKLEVSAVR